MFLFIPNGIKNFIYKKKSMWNSNSNRKSESRVLNWKNQNQKVNLLPNATIIKHWQSDTKTDSKKKSTDIKKKKKKKPEVTLATD
jgi:hypothetical protein